MDSVNVEIFGKDPKIQKAIQVANNVSVTKVPVLIVGEIGVGKKTMAKYIHESSTRSTREIAVVDCSEEKTLVANKILGYRDNQTNRFVKGVLETTNGGTVVLANVDSLDDEFQKRLHQIFQDLEDYDIDVRIISTTTKNLSKLVGAGKFYRGLYTYLSSNVVNITPLRERSHDLEMLIDFFVDEFSEGSECMLSTGAKDKLLKHYWTHNMHELKSVIETSIKNSNSQSLSENEIEIGERRTVQFSSDDDNEGIRLMSLKEAEKLLIKKALIHTSENRTQAAKILGVSIRTLRNKINEYRNDGNAYFINLR